MLSAAELKEYRQRRGLSIREVGEYCEMTHQLISDVENGKKAVTKANHRAICDAINKCYFAKYKASSQEDKKKDTTKKNTQSNKKQEKTIDVKI